MEITAEAQNDRRRRYVFHAVILNAAESVPRAKRRDSRISLLLVILFTVLPSHAQTFYAQSLQAALARDNPQVEFLVYDLRTHTALASTFADPKKPVPPGSLLKPFIALAYASRHTAFPTLTCHGHSDLCWKVHGSLTLPQAIAQSCNAYFLSLARDIKPADIPNLPPPPASATPEILIGLTPAWLVSPSDLVQGYAALLAAPASPAKTAILAGMRDSATRGTAARIGTHPGGVLTKTGTASCIDTPCKASGDGLLLAAVPAANPTLLLLVRQRATTGAMTAAAAARILTQLKALHAY